MKRWFVVLLCALLGIGAATARAAEPKKVLRIAFPVAETGFDPARANDLYSRTITPHIFEGLYRYDHLARPFKLRPQTADGMPQVSSDFRTWTFKVKPGIYFADDPAFKGQHRELTAADYVFSWKRFADPATKSPSYSELEEQGIVGLAELRDAALKGKKPFDYDSTVEGLRTLDRYTMQVKLAEARPRFIEVIAQGDLYGALAREVVEAAGASISEHPVGTGAFVLKEWRRSSFMALERNPGYREDHYDEEPNADDAEGQAIAAKLKGRRLPMVDRVEVSIIDEEQPRWLAFLNEQIDIVSVPFTFSNQAIPGGKLAPNLAKRGIRWQPTVSPDVTFTFFNMDDPIVGGYTPEKVALRRAYSLALNMPREIEIGWRGQAIAAQTGIPPGTYGYDADLKTENGDYDPARAKALLDLYGYVDRNGDGWREMPDGRPLVLRMATTPDQLTRQLNELWQKSLNAVGIRIEFVTAQWPEQLKAARAGKLMMWNLAVTASEPDGQDFLTKTYGPSAGSQNFARFKNERADEIFRRMTTLADGPERMRLFKEANEYGVAYMPYKYHVHRLINDLTQPWITGYRRPLFGLLSWPYIDVDANTRPSVH